MTGHTFAIFMLGVNAGFLLFFGVNRLTDWYWTRQYKKLNKDNEPQTDDPINFTYKYSESHENYMLRNEQFKKQADYIFKIYKDKSLKQQLREALENEDYELAAKLRDKIKSEK